MGVEHLLCCLWHGALTALQDNRAACLVTAIDYSKAINRLNYNECLKALAKAGANNECLWLVATFLEVCQMTLKLAQALSVSPVQLRVAFLRGQFSEYICSA